MKASSVATNILVVEDNPFDFQALNRTLSRDFIDWNVFGANSIDEMLSVISHTTPTVGIVDYHLPDATGLDAINILREYIDDIPIILVTGGVQASEAVSAIKLGAIEYIEKDFEGRYLDNVTRSIQTLLQRPNIVSLPAHHYRELLFERDLLRCRNGSFSLARKGHKIIEAICQHYPAHQGGMLYVSEENKEAEMVAAFGVNRSAQKQLLRPYAIDFVVTENLSGRLMLFKHKDSAQIGGSALATVKLELTNIVRKTKHIEALRRQATNDALTDALNRHVLLPRLTMELARVKRTKQPMGILMLDIDHFKALNDQYGHSAGDAVLAQFADVIRKGLRLTDSFIRYGGEEFIVILPGTDWVHAAMIAERLRNTVDNHVFQYEGNASLSITVSIGYATAVEGTEDPHKLIAAADTGLYAAKESGRNVVQYGELSEDE